jgi:hypothetical protein
MDVCCAFRTESLEATSRFERHPLRCFAARRRQELRAAFQLTYARYHRDGLANCNRFGLRILSHQLLDTSWVLLTKRGHDSLGTLTLVEDGAMGLPMEQLYPAEIWQLRRRQLRVAELACFALFDQSAAESMKVLRALLQLACEIAFRRGIEELVICIHPKRAGFYKRRLGFEEIGPLRDCPWVCHQPAVAMKLTLQAGSRATNLIAQRGLHSESFANPVDLLPLNFRDRAYFQQHLVEINDGGRALQHAA